MINIECPHCHNSFRIELVKSDKKIAQLEAEIARLRGIISGHKNNSIDFDNIFNRFGGNK